MRAPDRMNTYMQARTHTTYTNSADLSPVENVTKSEITGDLKTPSIHVCGVSFSLYITTISDLTNHKITVKFQLIN